MIMRGKMKDSLLRCMGEDENEWLYILGVAERQPARTVHLSWRRRESRQYDPDLRPYVFQELDREYIRYFERAGPNRDGSGVTFVKEHGYRCRGKTMDVQP